MSYGFVHQILTFTRTQDDSMTWGICSYSPYLLHRFILLRKYGQTCLTGRVQGVLQLYEREVFSIPGRIIAPPPGESVLGVS